MEQLSSLSRAAVGVVVIGRNEGDRLRMCLESLRGVGDSIIYVDSGSRDASVALSRGLGIEVLELDTSKPFTAARARNEGLRQLCNRRDDLHYVFFVDGDCQVVTGWLEQGCRFLAAHERVAVVFGRRRERHPERSVYNMLCDIEWGNSPIGENKACGGDALMRIEAFRQVQGFRADLICGEEPELCIRLRAAGWQIWRLDTDMTVHDAALYRFGQWWTRMLRGGYAYAQGVELHGEPPERHWVREFRGAWAWGLGLPAVTMLSISLFGWWSLSLLALYPLQTVRLALKGTRTARENWWRAGALVLGKFPEMLGQTKFLLAKIRRAKSGLIEYK